MPGSSGLRTVTRGALSAGVTASVILVLRAGQHQRSKLLIALFVAWVLSPFLALVLINRRELEPPTQAAVYGLMIAVSFISVTIFALQGAFPEMKAGFIYLVVPGGCWLLILMALATASLVLPRRR